jgi:SHS2 domain-containing protein
MKNSAPKRFEEVEHVADAALRVYGRDWSELLVNAAQGMFSLMAECEDTHPTWEHTVSLQAMDGETLLVDWLSELLYLHEVEAVVYTNFEILSASPNALRAIVKGTKKWTPRTAIKAVTFNDLNIEKTPEGYAATMVFDT